MTTQERAKQFLGMYLSDSMSVRDQRKPLETLLAEAFDEAADDYPGTPANVLARLVMSIENVLRERCGHNKPGGLVEVITRLADERDQLQRDNTLLNTALKFRNVALSNLYVAAKDVHESYGVGGKTNHQPLMRRLEEAMQKATEIG